MCIVNGERNDTEIVDVGRNIENYLNDIRILVVFIIISIILIPIIIITITNIIFVVTLSWLWSLSSPLQLSLSLPFSVVFSWLKYYNLWKYWYSYTVSDDITDIVTLSATWKYSHSHTDSHKWKQWHLGMMTLGIINGICHWWKHVIPDTSHLLKHWLPNTDCHRWNLLDVECDLRKRRHHLTSCHWLEFQQMFILTPTDGITDTFTWMETLASWQWLSPCKHLHSHTWLLPTLLLVFSLWMSPRKQLFDFLAYGFFFVFFFENLWQALAK